MHDAAFCAHRSRVLGERAYKIEFEFERRPGIALGNCRKNRAAKRGVEQRRGEAAVHRANWIVVVEFRYALEYGASLFGFNQVKPTSPLIGGFGTVPAMIAFRKPRPS